MIAARREIGSSNALDFDGLCRKIQTARQASGMRRAQSELSLVGETRTFAEVLDAEVEKVVLTFIREQGYIADMAWELRSSQLQALQDYSTSVFSIDNMLERYRSLGGDVLRLLEYLDANVLALKKIVQLHDACFDLKLGPTYFDTRIGRSSKQAHLLSLHHQDGICAIMSTIRRGFEDLHDARNAITGAGEAHYGPQRGVFGGSSRAIPRITFGNRLASIGHDLHTINRPRSIKATTASAKAKSTNNLMRMIRSGSNAPEPEGLEKSLSDLEPVLRKIDAVAERVLVTQRQTFAEVLALKGKMALEASLDDIPGSPGETESERIRTDTVRFSAHTTGLYINLLVTFLYLANQYVVAPTSGEYARLVGMTPAMSGIIIGLCPAAALVSSLLYSYWSNHSFKQPLLLCIYCGIAGNLVYAAALQCGSANMLLLGRLLTGFGGPRVISRRYIADHVPVDKRLHASSAFVTAGAMGLACGPLISSLVERSGLTFQWRVFQGRTMLLWYQAETAPGWIMAALWLVALALVVPFFAEPQQQFMRATKLRKHAESVSRMNLAALAERQFAGVENGHGGSGRGYGSNGGVPTLKQLELQQLQGQGQGQGGSAVTTTAVVSRMHSASPINLTAANNNVFNFVEGRMEHAIPADSGTGTATDHGSSSVSATEHTRLLSGGHHHSGAHVHFSSQPPQLLYTGLNDTTSRPSRDRTPLHVVEAEALEGATSWWELITAEVMVILAIYVVNKVGQELVISSIPLVTQAAFGWTREVGGYYMTVVGASVLPMMLFINRFTKDAEERELVLQLSFASLGCLVLMLHLGVLGDYTVLQYVLGSVLLFAFLNALEGVVMALLAKLISPELAKGTFNSGLLATEAGTFGRVMGDMCITWFGSAHEPVNAMFSPVVIMVAASIALVWYYYDRLE